MGAEKLAVGAFGGAVSLLQKRLADRGFGVGSDEAARGYYGPSTRDAVRECQRTHVLVATGVVDMATSSILNMELQKERPTSVIAQDARPSVASTKTGEKNGGGPAAPTKDRTANRSGVAAPAVDPADLVNARRRAVLDAAFQNKAAMRVGFTENLKSARLGNADVVARVEKAFEGFRPSALRAGDPKRRFQVERGGNPRSALEQAMNGRLKSIQDAAPAGAIAIHKDSSLIQWDGHGNDRKGTIDLGRLIDFTQVGKVSRRAAESACKIEAEAQNVLAAIEGSAPAQSPDKSSNGHPAGRAETATKLVERTVNQQMWSATSPEEGLTYGLIPNSADKNPTQAAIMQTFELRPSPSDVKSYHDFNVLQIAFEHVWTELFDGELEGLGKQLYKEYVGLKDFLGYDPNTADRPISSLDDLKWLITEIRSLSQVADDGIPVGTGAGAGSSESSGPKGQSQLGKDAEGWVDNNLPGGRVGTAVATAGLSELFLAALNELGKAGEKPMLDWSVLDGRVLTGGGRITATIEQNVVASGQVGFRLVTDWNSHRKGVAFQRWDEGSGKFVNNVFITNKDKPAIRWQGRDDYLGQMDTFSTALMPTGVMEFTSQESEYEDRGRYVLAKLDAPNGLADRAMVTFYWTEQR